MGADGAVNSYEIPIRRLQASESSLGEEVTVRPDGQGDREQGNGAYAQDQQQQVARLLNQLCRGGRRRFVTEPGRYRAQNFMMTSPAKVNWLGAVPAAKG